MVSGYSIRFIDSSDQDWAEKVISQFWGSKLVVAHGVKYFPSRLPGLVACHGKVKVGLLTYHLGDSDCEIVTLNSLQPNLGIGTALLKAVGKVASQSGVRRLWLVTTNDNLPALRFYQKRGFKLVAVHCNALEKSRQLKPSLPLNGLDGIPLRDEIELEMVLSKHN